MKVQNEHLTGASDAARAHNATATERNSQLRPGDPAPLGGGDRVELSGLASRIGRAEALAAAHRAERIRELSKVHAAGRYHVDATRLSRKIVDVSLAERAGGR